MQKKTVLWIAAGAIAAIAAGTVVYYLRKRKRAGSQHGTNHKKDKHLTHAFSKAKGHASGEYTL